MNNTLETTKFETILETERLVTMCQMDITEGSDSETRVTALGCYKSAKRNLYRLIDELTHDEIVAYGQWRKNQ